MRSGRRQPVRPLTLAELTDFFVGSWSLFDCLEMNFEADDIRSTEGTPVNRPKNWQQTAKATALAALAGRSTPPGVRGDARRTLRRLHAQT